MAMVKVGRVFTRRDFSPAVLGRMRRLAAGRTVWFPGTRERKYRVPEKALAAYARGARAEDAATEGDCSRRLVFYYLKKERGGGRIRYWRQKGLSVSELARLYGRSQPWVRKGLKV
jgi:hypothetical protein